MLPAGDHLVAGRMPYFSEINAHQGFASSEVSSATEVIACKSNKRPLARFSEAGT